MTSHSTDPSSSSITSRRSTTLAESTRAFPDQASRRGRRARQLPDYPETGQTLGEFRLLAELDRGAVSRVYLAEQVGLADRLLVLKLTPYSNEEHLTLARLQHTQIVPLYWVRDFPDRHLRSLCMPCLGGATLRQLLRALRPVPPEGRTGRDLLEALRTSVADARLYWESASPNRRFLEQASYVQAVCWIGICLADALHYAHERGLVHFDVKPANVLLTADCEPMLLDFHVSRGPVLPCPEGPPQLGGTTAYMSPEQRAALLACRTGEPMTTPVDGRSDVYALGLVLRELLYGRRHEAPPSVALPPRADLSVGLRDILGCCLCPDPAARYSSAAQLADDLRRHLTHRPLVGVRNRSLSERWRKWRRRRPHALLVGLLAALCLATAAAFAALQVVDTARQRHDAEAALAQGRRQLDQRHFSAALETCERALVKAGSGDRDPLRAALDRCRRRALRGVDILAMHRDIEGSRYLVGDSQVAADVLRAAERRCWDAWQAGDRLLASDAGLAVDIEETVRHDLLDAASLWADFHVRLAAPDQLPQARREALEVLDVARAMFGPSAVLCRQRRSLGAAGEPDADPPPRSAWEHYLLGRWLLQQGELIAAAEQFARAVRVGPQDLWPWYGKGLCAYRRGRLDEAITAFTVCVALAPDSAACYHNRALALAARGEVTAALDDYDRALERDARLGPAALNRGALHLSQGQFTEAEADFRAALEHGANPTAVYYNLALVHHARREPAAARAAVERALQYDPGHVPARELRERLRR
jgi:serine/threonine protein kinase/Flp pilus assembly protein TadD